MNENTMQIAIALALVNLLAWGAYSTLQNEPEIIYKYKNTVSSNANVTVTIEFGNFSANSTTFFESNFNNTNQTSITFENIFVENDTSAYAATIVASQIGGFSVEVTWHSFGPYIHTIDSVSDSTHYWGLYHNGKYAMVGAGDLQLQDNDNLLWIFETANW